MASDSLSFSAYCGDDGHVFANYSYADASAVNEELARLNDRRFNVWHDEGIAAAIRWTQQLEETIGASSAFVAFITPRFVASDPCINELQSPLRIASRFSRARSPNQPLRSAHPGGSGWQWPMD